MSQIIILFDISIHEYTFTSNWCANKCMRDMSRT